jgi:ketosteroid isomerase-like protein
MSEARNTQLVKDAYAAFQKGDIRTILDMLDENVEWHGVIGTEGVLPQAGRRRGRAAVAEFFRQVAESTTFEAFEPREFIAQGDQVCVVGSYKGIANTTGEAYATDWVMIFRVRDGRLASFREFTDSAQLVRVYGAPVRVA